MMKINHTRRAGILILLIAIFTVTGCKKDFTAAAPGDGTTASLNFYGMSETFPFYNSINSSYGGVGIFVDKEENASYFINSQLATLPYFEFNGLSKLIMFPYLAADPLGKTMYLDYKAGEHQVIFSYLVAKEADKTVGMPLLRMADTTIKMAAGSHSSMYLADAPAAEGARAVYKLVRTEQPLEKAVTVGKVSVRFVNLSPDAGNLRVSLVDANGTENTSLLPQNLAFAGASDYTALDISGSTDRQLLIRVYSSTGNIPLITSAIPAQAGHSFEMVIHGFKAAHQQQVVSGVNADGSPSFKTVTLPVSLSLTARQTY
ncbi:MAG: hypothetical protein V4594_21910 [Bacteroidota bacterium]